MLAPHLSAEQFYACEGATHIRGFTVVGHALIYSFVDNFKPLVNDIALCPGPVHFCVGLEMAFYLDNTKYGWLYKTIYKNTTIYYIDGVCGQPIVEQFKSLATLDFVQQLVIFNTKRTSEVPHNIGCRIPLSWKNKPVGIAPLNISILSNKRDKKTTAWEFAIYCFI